MSDAFAEARARAALDEAGLDMHATLTRASSVTNEVWLTDEYVIRVNRQPNQRLRREAMLGPRLPREVGYSEIVAYGGTLGADWLILTRMPGGPLSRAWPGMDSAERREAVEQLAGMLRALHGVTPPEGLPDVAVPQLLGGHSFRAVDPLLEACDRLARLPNVDVGLVAEAKELVLATCATIEPFDVPTLVHGDLHFENVLWNGYRVTALLDFEYCRPAPADVDLDVFLRFCYFPYLHVAPDYEAMTKAEDYAEVPGWMAEFYPELFAHPNQLDRLVIYAIAYNVNDLLADPPPEPPRQLSRHHAHNRLERLVRGMSHLHQWAGEPTFDPLDLGPGIA